MGLGIASALVITVPAQAAQLESWWFNARENQLVFTTDTAVQPRAQMIFNPTRIVVDLPGTTLNGPPRSQAVGGAIREIRAGQFDSQTTRLVIELNEGYQMDPRAIEVQGIRSNRWIVQLPGAESDEVAAPAATAENAVRGDFIRGAETLVNGVIATPDGFFIRTAGRMPEIEVERRGDRDEERQIIISLTNASISPFLQAAALPVNRYSVSRWEITQESQPPSTRVVITLDPNSPDWDVTSTNLGGIVMVPPPGVSISSIPDQKPGSSQAISVPPNAEQPNLPTQPQIPTDTPRLNNGQVLVAIDPGHGGRDPGAVGIGGLQEKHVIFPISLRVAEILRDDGVQVIMTRTDDRTLDLEPRVNLANRANATIFLSIHANAISLSRPDVNGVETYYASDAGERLASVIHANVLAETGMGDRGVKESRFYVLRYTDMPAALIEVGFVTGEEDAPQLADPEWREEMAQAIAQGLLQYLQPYR
ncbi:MAG: N-acetylmuramoyl-L-alanine amidase [Cyanobacteria bacterium J06639_14]